MDISENIKKLRESKGYTQSKLADILQMERGNYHRLENRGNKMTIEQLQSIADALGVSLEELLGIESKGGAGDGERVKELEKEVGYLKKIIAGHEWEKTSTKKFVSTLIEMKLLEVLNTHKLNVGKVVCTHKVTGEIVTFPWEDLKIADHSPLYANLNKAIENDEYTIDSIFSDSETNLIKRKAIEVNYDYWDLLNTLGYIEDEAFQRLIEQQGRKLSKSLVW